MGFQKPLTALAAMAAALVLGTPSLASDDFQRVQSETEFVEIVAGRELAIVRPFYLRNAIKLQVRPEGEIAGTALRKPVTGAWSWQNGYFCREMTYGDNSIAPNCQLVAVKGDEVRFIADQGAGDRADFRLD
ncbi:hypothetical protein Dshi_3035 [Dinoroseobacter shibae DFL 12 = DSM 16493]|jgi:hypothetical protein|uniref:Dihydrodipicolinate reductase n=1 Tax=Dinoroseobacter shibae (strain DSM 16493 / NCIMB 14021 / DFL 12) TaxID=398580 RepID=A8LKI5_DINSH|nr:MULTISPECIES: hypothetical protein [Dinoroseobacter]ABV94768.1 hypothetical protein Dshi_3035 [Dinoroseobacter shibae DFL 12 = DSM 16493]MDD9716790.1 dihydrodipicolinate reductase [Dinoroseobacter sp. PD6]URF46188.1 dihydrodipicolinate reductase [Dinoroseobacter shibae]URF50495.1 dihydrodipicolinate reductase [Dinoroseobacter shibae]